jgi:hypothetical protein
LESLLAREPFVLGFYGERQPPILLLIFILISFLAKEKGRALFSNLGLEGRGKGINFRIGKGIPNNIGPRLLETLPRV